MFEDSLIDSNRRIKTRSRYFTIVGVLLNSSVLASMVLVPLIYPEALPKIAMAILLVAPSPPQTAPHPPQKIAEKVRPVSELIERSIVAPSRIPQHAKIIAFEAPVVPMAVPGMGDGSGDSVKAMTNILVDVAQKPLITQASLKKVPVSSGVMQGNLVIKNAPIYPAIAKAAHISGTVVLQATISKTGTIENLHVISGHSMLQQAAIDAVRTWKYRPYLLNGEPVEVETEINVVFNLGG